MEEKLISSRLQELLSDEDNQIKVDDAAKIVGCWKALSKQGLTHDALEDDALAMKRAVAFCQVIEKSTGGKTHKVSSKHIASMFQDVVAAYQEEEKKSLSADEDIPPALLMQCEASHVDGGMNAGEKEQELTWLKAETPENTCRILSNVRCLSEGVDVPALDAVLFLSPRGSQVDVVQSVGRVMRNAPGKKRGYVILPVVIPSHMQPHEALNDNKIYRVVWQVLQALRSHDDRFDAMINRLDLNGAEPAKMEVIAVTKSLPKAREKKGTDPAGSGHTIGKPSRPPQPQDGPEQAVLFESSEIERAIYAKVVQKCGNRSHWEEWATDIAKIAQTHIARINGILENPANVVEQAAFQNFAEELRDDLNDSLSDADIVEMLAQHVITRPVFEALFSDYSFAANNPISQGMQKVLDVLQEHNLDKEADTLQKFYESVKIRAEGIHTAHGKQKIVVELYDKFFRNAFPRMTQKLGIVYTPVEVVDFIIRSVNDLLQSEFGQTLGDDNVHIIDPFTGTGTFITRLMQLGLMTPQQLQQKYQGQMHANEIVLLAYYIATINIESAYHALVGGDYVPFEGICLTDTFQMYEKDDLVSMVLEDNSERRKRQKSLDIKVIMGNPPYSVGQGSANDNNQNVTYPSLSKRIEETYAAKSTANLSKALYDSYVRAFRWASDRIGESGIIGFISGSGFIDKNTTDGMRKCLAEEFSSIYILNLRGDIRKNMLSKGRAQEGGNIFGSGSMTGTALTLFVKNPHGETGKIYYHNIGDDLSQQKKLDIIKEFSSIKGITQQNSWQNIIPNEHADWIGQRNNSFNDFLPLGDKKGKGIKLFENYSLGIATNRDAWCFNNSKKVLVQNMHSMIGTYHSELARFNEQHKIINTKNLDILVDNFITPDKTQISWTVNLKKSLSKKMKLPFEKNALRESSYRPFTKQWMYYSKHYNERTSQIPQIYPLQENFNIMICVTGVGARSGFSAFISNKITDLHFHDTGQCFPLYLYEKGEATKAQTQGSLLETSKPQEHSEQEYVRRDAITAEGLKLFSDAYPTEKISKEDIFYYVYGILHSQDYRNQYADNLSKELPRIPCVKGAENFWGFSKAGRALAELHLNYEKIEAYPATVTTKAGDSVAKDSAALYHVEKMKFGKGKDKSIIHYNNFITISDIPLRAYDYIVNGKSAIDWVVERQCVKTDKASGIINDANLWATETMGNPKYPLDLLLSVITVSLKTLDIVEALPSLHTQGVKYEL